MPWWYLQFYTHLRVATAVCLTTTAGLLPYLSQGMGSCKLGRAPAGPSPLGTSGESTFLLKMVVTLSKPYLLTEGRQMDRSGHEQQV